MANQALCFSLVYTSSVSLDHPAHVMISSSQATFGVFASATGMPAQLSNNNIKVVVKILGVRCLPFLKAENRKVVRNA
jgi:hypothetical protein